VPVGDNLGYIHEALEERCQRGDLVEVILWYCILEKEE
jgi:hypothetical protein